MWLYQLNGDEWPPERFRYEIWEGQRWRWPIRQQRGGKTLAVGDTVVFFYAPSVSDEPGFFGWAIVMEYLADENLIYFMPTAPTDFLKMCPWWDNKEAEALANKIRGTVKRGTMWKVPKHLTGDVSNGIRRWFGGRFGRPAAQNCG
jgi:hypothetical protein